MSASIFQKELQEKSTVSDDNSSEMTTLDKSSVMLSNSASKNMSPTSQEGGSYRYDETALDDLMIKQDSVFTSESEGETTYNEEIKMARGSRAKKDRHNITSNSSWENSRKEVQRMVRRLSSFHERIPERIQNFLLKYILFFFNFLSWLAGLTAMGLGTWQLTDDGMVITDAVDFVLDPFIIICIIGAITFTVAFLGCVGAAREHTLMLKLFYICLSIVLVVELLCGILVAVLYSKPEARELLRLTPDKLLKHAILRYRDEENVRVWMDTIQRQFRCCGISSTDYGYKDWQLNMYYNRTESNPSIYRCAVPESCCIYFPGERMNKMCGFDKTNKQLTEVKGWIFTQGCVKGFGEWISRNEKVILLTACIVMFMQALGVVFARIFTKRVEKRTRWQQMRNRREDASGNLTLDPH